jgi:3-deoxy-D-manno-octulosonic-acid transferase
MTINHPFSKLVYVVGDPIWVPADANEEVIEERRRAIEAALDQVTKRAYALVGGNIARVTPPLSVAPTGPVPAGLSLKVYAAGTRLFKYIAPILLWWRERRGKEDPSRRSERYGIASLARPAGPLMWLHAASVGETNAVLPVIDRLLAKRPDLSILLTTGTLTSAALAKRRLPPRAFHQYIVHDAPDYVQAFLDHWKPDVGVFAESEIWPNLIMEASRRSIPLALVNARMSTKSAQKWRRLRGMSLPLFSRFEVVLAQNEQLARTFTSLGARKVEALGNLKIDAPPPVVDAVELDRLRQALGDRPMFVAASTHDPEEGTVADAHAIIARRLPGFCTILAPRHPQRGRAIAELLRAKGLRTAQRSKGELPGRETEIYIADTIGELGTLYSLTRVAFIGGSLFPHGGQNPIEAIGHGAAVITGPHWINFRDFYRALLRRDGARQVASAEELAAAVVAVLTEDGEQQRMRQGAAAAIESLAGALEGTVETLEGMLPGADSKVCARAS